MTAPPHQVTQLLQEWSEGDENALAQLMPLVHEELHCLAHQHMRRESAGHVLQTSALIAESSFGGYTGISKLKPALDLLSMVRPIAASPLLGW